MLYLSPFKFESTHSQTCVSADGDCQRAVRPFAEAVVGWRQFGGKNIAAPSIHARFVARVINLHVVLKAITKKQSETLLVRFLCLFKE